MNHWLVDMTNELREAQALLSRLSFEALGAPDYRPLIAAYGAVTMTLNRYRAQLADLCQPWFEVQP
jgi:hypothetical protein